MDRPDQPQPIVPLYFRSASAFNCAAAAKADQRSTARLPAKNKLRRFLQDTDENLPCQDVPVKTITATLLKAVLLVAQNSAQTRTVGCCKVYAPYDSTPALWFRARAAVGTSDGSAYAERRGSFS